MIVTISVLLIAAALIGYGLGYGHGADAGREQRHNDEWCPHRAIAERICLEAARREQ